MSFRAISRVAAYLGTGSVVGSIATAYWYRPFPDHSQSSAGPQRSYSSSAVSLYEDGAAKDPFLLPVARALVVVTATTVVRFFMKVLNTTEVKKDENYQRFLETVKNRPAGQPLITVANHRSVLDDPAVFTCLLPFHMNIRPKYTRWNICTQEICYQGDGTAAFFGAGKTLPVWRGGGVNQKLLLDFMRKVANGDWCHVFPEAGCWQTTGLGGREGHEAQRVGKLKWGVGKLIAHSPVKPVVIPFYHVGMEGIMPQDPVTRDVIAKYPGVGQNIRVLFGEALQFDDLLEAFEKKHGPLRKHQATPTPEEVEDYHKYWDSTRDEMLLYSAITRRIEDALEALGRAAEIEP